jgi:hypothetical protein
MGLYDCDMASLCSTCCWIIVMAAGTLPLMTHKYRGCIIVLSINKSVEPNEEQKVLTSGFDQGFSIKY